MKIYFILLIVTTYLHAYQFPPANQNNLTHNQELKKLSDGISEIAQQASSAIVFVSVAKVMRSPSGGFNPFEYWFPELREQLRNQKPQRSGIGSGFIVDLAKGYVITNNHVVESADEISLKLANEESYDATVVGRDSNTDVAVVQIKNKNFNRKGLSQLPLDDSDRSKVGELVVALGAPFGLESSISFGVISAIGRGNLRLTKLGNFIQTDAAINPGNSGGPLINVSGAVIGMNTAIYSQDGGYNGIGFAVPSNLIRRIASQLIEKGKVDRGYIGVSLQEIDEDMSGHLGLPKGLKGALVREIVQKGPADKGGLKQGDVVTSVGGERTTNPDEVANKIGLRNPGEKIELVVYRNGQKKNISIQIENYPSEPEQLARPSRSQNYQSPSKIEGVPSGFGLYLAKLNKDLQRRFGITSNAGAFVVDLQTNSPAARFGILPGDVIVEVTSNRQSTTIKSPEDFQKAIKGKSSILLRIERSGQFQFLGISQ